MECTEGRAGAPRTLARVRTLGRRVHDPNLSAVPLVPEAKGHKFGSRAFRKEVFCEAAEAGILGLQALTHLWMGRVDETCLVKSLLMASRSSEKRSGLT